MNSRLQQIIQYLLKSTDLQTSSDLANDLQVSSKTIRTDLKKLNELLDDRVACIESYRGKGYRLTIIDEKEFRQFLQKDVEGSSQVVPTEPEGRIRLLMGKLLLQSSYIKMDQVADELFISRSTLQSDLNSVRDTLKQYHLSLDHKPNHGIKVIGDEMQIRFCISEYVFNQHPKMVEQTADWLEILPKDDIEWIRNSILAKLRKHKIIITDISLHNLITHIAIACKRIRIENVMEFPPEELNQIMDKKEFLVAKEIVEEMEEKLQVTFSVNETAYLAVHLQGTKMLHSESELEMANSVLNDDIQGLTKATLERIDQVYDLKLSGDEELALAMSLHLGPAVNRYQYKMNLRNPMLDDIKTKYPLSFEAALAGTEVIREELGISINDDEVGYMALHIGAALERQKRNGTEGKRCLIVCASGLGTAQLLLYKLQDYFGDQLTIQGTTEYYNLHRYSLNDLDFIISTIPITEQLEVPVIQISTLLGDRDVKEIEAFLDNDVAIVKKFLSETFTFLRKDFSTREDVIQFLDDRLSEAGLVPDGFMESVLERERYSPTSFGNLVAVPHTLEPQVDETFWSIVTLKNPVQWGDKLVQFICLLNINKWKSDDLKPMYDVLVKLLDNRSLVKELIQCETYAEFIAVLKEI